MACKVLFVSSFIGQNYSGGSVAAQNNLALCKRLFAGAEIDAYGFALSETPVVKSVNYMQSHKGNISTFINYTFGNAGSLTFLNIKQLLSIFDNGNYQAVFLDGSLLGKLAKKIKQRNKHVVVLSFFHNLERHFFRARMATHPAWLPLYYSACYNEKLSSTYADYILCFTQRDAAGIKKYYHKNIHAVLPIVVEDKLQPEKLSPDDIAKKNPPKLLFVGSDFFANTQGLRWFVQKVMPNVKASLVVAGKGMEKYKAGLEGSNIKVLGTVPSLAELYYDADMVVAPLFKGSGMKVKVAEALMMGKCVAGTDEAWQGYNYNSTVGFVCNTADDFIKAINGEIRLSRYNAASRKLYEDYYSPKSQEEIISHLSNEIKNKAAV